MNTSPLLLLVVVASAATSAVVTTVTRCETPASAAAADPDELLRLSQSFAVIEARQAEIVRALSDLRSERAASPRGDARLPLGEIEASVARALEKLAPKEPAEPAAAEKPKGKEAKSKSNLTAQDAYDRLLAGDISEFEFQAIWKEITENGRVDELIALFEARADANPSDAGARVDLGRAYLQKLFTVGDGPEKGIWAIKADKSFDKALELDDQNWDARFAKAVSLSYWPPIFGKANEAIKHFEVLVTQQQGQYAKPEFVQPHLLLGQLYLQQGQKDKAIAAWQKGLLQFPGNTQLEQQIASAQSQ